MFNKCVTCWSLLKVWFIPWGGNCASVTQGGLTRHQGYGRYPRRPFSCRRDSTVFPVVAFVTHVHVQVHVAVISYTHTYARTKKITTDFFVIIMH